MGTAVWVWFNRQARQWGGLRWPPARAPALREGVNVFVTGTEEIEKIHAHVFAGFTKAQQNQVVSESQGVLPSVRAE